MNLFQNERYMPPLTIHLNIQKNPHYEDSGDHWIDPNLLFALQLHPSSKLFLTSYQKIFLNRFKDHRIVLQEQHTNHYRIINVWGQRAIHLQHKLHTMLHHYPDIHFPSNRKKINKIEDVSTHKSSLTHKRYTRLSSLPSRKQKIHQLSRASSVRLTHQRCVKSKVEIQKIRKACQLTCNAIKYIYSNLSQYKSTREIYHALHKFICDHHPHNTSKLSKLHLLVKRFDYLAYSTILTVNGNCISGKTGKVDLHPTKLQNVNFSTVKHPILLLDVGVKYEGYCADITRTFPVHSFSPYQQKVYNAVKRLYTLGESMVKPGVYFIDIQTAVYKLLQHELKQLGIDDYINTTKYMPHTLGHSVGLQVHDQPPITQVGPLQEGIVLTIEPGIYLPEVCVRIENTIVVTTDGCDVLSGGVKW